MIFVENNCCFPCLGIGDVKIYNINNLKFLVNPKMVLGLLESLEKKSTNIFFPHFLGLERFYDFPGKNTKLSATFHTFLFLLYQSLGI